MMQKFLQNDQEILKSLQSELERQRTGLEMIPSENFTSEAVLAALGSVATNKYAEGYPGRRYYGGCHFIDEIESLAIERAKKIFQAEHANVQPHSGAPANIAVYHALLNPGDTVLGMDLSHGGHLTHGHPVTQSAKIYNFIRYKTTPSGEIDYDHIEKLAKDHKPKMILVGYSAYSREINYERIAEIAAEVDALTMADISHIAGLIAGGVMNNPTPFFDVVTTTTHKTLRGPRGGLILCKAKHAKAIDKAVFPGLQGGPHQNVITAKAIAFGEILNSDYKSYAEQIVKNAKVLEKRFLEAGYKLAFGGTENHLLLVDVTSKGLTGDVAEKALDLAGITVNKNMIPDDTRSPMDPSGIRFGTPALTTRGLKEADMEKVASFMLVALENANNPIKLNELKAEVTSFISQFPLYPELNYLA
jgi:glycine hydroxymethyltransferase